MIEHNNLIPINDPSEILENLSDEEELDFWDTHYMTEAYLSKVEEASEEERPQARSSSKQINVRMDESTIERLKDLAEDRGVGYQTLMKDFIKERLYEEEIRAGTVERGIDLEGMFSATNRFLDSISHTPVPYFSKRHLPQMGGADWRRSSRIPELFHSKILKREQRLALTYIDSAKILEGLTKLPRETIGNMGDIPIARKREDK
jgi:predicted DNA binding CopG/RHH family protein